MAFEPENRERAREIVARYPFARSAVLPLLHLAQEQDGWVSPEAIEEVECLAACDTAPVFQVNYEFHGNATDESATSTIEEYRSGARVPRGVSGGKRS